MDMLSRTLYVKKKGTNDLVHRQVKMCLRRAGKSIKIADRFVLWIESDQPRSSLYIFEPLGVALFSYHLI